METPRFQYQTELQKLKLEFDRLKNQEPKEHEFRHQPHVYIEHLQDYYEKIGELSHQIDTLEKKNIPRTPSEKAAHLDIRNEGFSLN